MKASKHPYNNWFKVPEKNKSPYKIMEELGFVTFPYSGFPLFLPIGKKVINNIEKVIRNEAEVHDFSEIYLPLIQHEENFDKSGRSKIFNREFMRLSGKRENFLLTPTNEEFFLSVTTKNLQSYRQLPIRYFQIADKFRDILKPKGLMRSSQFLMADMCSVDADENSLNESKKLFESMLGNIFNRFNIKTFRLEKNDGNYIDFVVPCEDGETTIAFDKNKKNARYATSEDESFEKASSIGMYFIFDDFDKDSVLYTDRNMERKPIKFGTYGIGIQRCFHAILSQNIDEFGINFPKEVRPFDFSIMLLNPNSEKQKDLAERLYKESLKINLSPLLDDRIALIKDKAEYSDFIGAEYKVIIGEEEAKEENLTIKKRGEKIGEKMCIEKFIERYDK